jgi:hypothetical protein
MCAAGNDLLLDSIGVTKDGDFNPYLADDIGGGGDGGGEMARESAQWIHDALGSETSSIANGQI